MMRAFRRFFRREEGNVTAEFVVAVPVILMIFFASFEAGYAMLRLVWLERSLDITIRDLRTGSMGTNPSHEQVRERICELNFLLPNCNQNLMVEMQIIEQPSWTGFTTPPTCVDRTTDVRPKVTFTQGTSNEVVTVRACEVFDPFFPSTRYGLGLKTDASGGYQLAARGAFVNEPRE